MLDKWAMSQGASDVGNLMVGQCIPAGKRQPDTINLCNCPFGLHAVGDHCPEACAAVGPLAWDASL